MGVPETMAKGKYAGVVVRMATGSNTVAAPVIATEGGIMLMARSWKVQLFAAYLIE